MIFKAFANCAGSVSSQQTVLRGTAICVIPASEDSVRWRHYLGRCEKKETEHRPSVTADPYIDTGIPVDFSDTEMSFRYNHTTTK